MQEYYFLYGLAFVYLVFAAVQDIRTTEISNWLSYTFISFVLAYRAFYAVTSENLGFFVYGLTGVLVFFVLGILFYYGRVFGGGDAKLLAGLGGVFPYENLGELMFVGGSFIFLLFLVGAVYTLVFTLFLVRRNWEKFSREFGKQIMKGRVWLIAGIIATVFLEIYSLVNLESYYFGILSLVFVLGPLLWIYTKSVEISCMIVWKKPSELIEGDQLEKEVRMGRYTIKKRVHGLSKEDIVFLRKKKKKVLVKEGVVFGPVFVVAFLIMIGVLWYSDYTGQLKIMYSGV